MVLSSPASLTPATLALIRAQSQARTAPEIAASLNWDVAKLIRTARRFLIPIYGASQSVETETATDTTPPLPPSKVCAPMRPRPRLPEGRELDGMSLDDIIAGLPNKQGVILAILKRNLDGPFVDGALICARMGIVHRDGIGSSIIHLSSKLSRGSRYRIESKKGPSGGYRLVTVKDEAKTEVASVIDSSVHNTSAALS